MALQIGRALARGARRGVSLSGIAVLALTGLYQVAFVGAVNTLVADLLPAEVRPSDVEAIGFTLPVSTDAAAALAVASLLVGVGVFLVAARLLARDLPALSTLPASAFTRRLGRALASAVVVSVVLSIAIPIGLVLFVVPGLFLAVSLQFAVFAIAVEDAGPIGALRRSWALASGNRWRLFALIVVLAVAGGVSGAIGSVFSFVDPLAGQLASLAVNSVFVVLTYGILADAFLQLRDEPPFDGRGASGTADFEAL
jgi:hypothetical protein